MFDKLKETKRFEYANGNKHRGDERKTTHVQSSEQIHERLPEHRQCVWCAQLSGNKSGSLLHNHVSVFVRRDVWRRRPRFDHPTVGSVDDQQRDHAQEKIQRQRNIRIVLRWTLHFAAHGHL